MAKNHFLLSLGFLPEYLGFLADFRASFKLQTLVAQTDLAPPVVQRGWGQGEVTQHVLDERGHSQAGTSQGGLYCILAWPAWSAWATLLEAIEI